MVFFSSFWSRNIHYPMMKSSLCGRWVCPILGKPDIIPNAHLDHHILLCFSYEIAIIQADANASASGKSQRQAVAEAGQGWGLRCPCGCVWKCGYGSIPINTIFRGMNIHLPAILMFTRVQGFDPSPCVYHQIAIETGKKTRWWTSRPAGGTVGYPVFRTNPVFSLRCTCFFSPEVSQIIWKKNKKHHKFDQKLTWVTPRGPQDPSCGMTDEHIVMGGNDFVKPNSTAKVWPRS